MSNVVFDSDNNNLSEPRQAKVLGLTGWLMRHSFGLLKTKQRADIFMVAVAIVFFLISVSILFRTFA